VGINDAPKQPTITMSAVAVMIVGKWALFMVWWTVLPKNQCCSEYKGE